MLELSEMEELLVLAYLGIVTPAFSHAWIRAEPAAVMVSTDRSTRDPNWHTFYRDLLAICSTLSALSSPAPHNPQTQSLLPIVSWTSAGRLLLVANVLEALQLCLLARRAERASDCRNMMSPRCLKGRARNKGDGGRGHNQS